LPRLATRYRAPGIGKLRVVLRRLPATLVLTLTALLVLAAPVLAHDGGEGLYGETNDQVVTNAGFILIIFFPLFCLVASLIQWQLEKRKDARKAAAKARAQVPGGW
jgi:ABC-type nickel/cobalt efflux system permease component RcnA